MVETQWSYCEATTFFHHVERDIKIHAVSNVVLVVYLELPVLNHSEAQLDLY